ncbi:LVIVD repeat-containing protein [Streptomyces sp. NPDC060020]|uniref:LVIVD repeat-containing protein n=1 Tax=Streptomyces sp. NPDC060020 TaxID=3347038 RepID=UPI0036B23243
MTSLHTRRVRNRRVGVAAAAAGLLTTLLAAGPASATPDPGDLTPGSGSGSRQSANSVEGRELAPGDIPGQDEIVHSRNIKHLANIPSTDPANINSDLAFQGRYAYAGSYSGFTIYDIANPKAPKTVTQVLCPGGQNDVSVLGDLLFLSTDSSRSDDSCNSVSQPATEKSSWEGIKIFDIKDKKNPKYIKSVETACGSHTHTLVPGDKDIYLYVASYSPNDAFPDCKPPHDGISVVKVPKKAPTKAAVVAFPILFPDGGNPGGPTNPGVSKTTGCHDITVLPSKKLAAGACMGDGILFDISRPEQPKVIDRVQDNVNFAFWHSATFNEKADKVVFTDELGGGGGATCNEATGPNRGADGIYDITGRGDQRKLVFRGYFKIPRHQADTENCVAHNGSLVPVGDGRDIMVQAWYQGGVSVWEFTDSARPREIAYFERGPLTTDQLGVGGSWSAYYYNGHIYSNDIAKGLDVLRLDDWRTDSAKWVWMDRLNVQSQPEYH